MLESLKHKSSCFATLTYDDAHLPPGGSLVIRDYQGFLKNLRGRLSPNKLRFYMVGEYGEIGQRPHYHAALFGVGPDQEKVVQDAWGKGYTYLGELTRESSQYIAGYVTKKMTHPESQCSRKCTHPPLNGRIPEFARMSLKPGIGAGAMEDVGRALLNNLDLIEINGDVPFSLKHGLRSLPLGRYLMRKLRKEMGFQSESTPKEKLFEVSVQRMLEDIEARKTPETFKKYVESKKQKINIMEKRLKIFSRRNTL